MNNGCFSIKKLLLVLVLIVCLTFYIISMDELFEILL